MLTFTVATSRKKWLVVRVPSGSVAIYEREEGTARRHVPVALSDMPDAVDYLADRLLEDSDRELFIWYKRKCVAYVSFDIVDYALCTGHHLKSTASVRGSLDYCVDYLEGLTHAVD